MKSKLPGKKAKPPVSKESFGLPGKTYKTPANAVKTTSLPKENKTKRLAGMQGPSNFKKRSLSEVANMALAVTSVAGLGKAVASKQLANSAAKAANAIARSTKTPNAAARIRVRNTMRAETKIGQNKVRDASHDAALNNMNLKNAKFYKENPHLGKSSTSKDIQALRRQRVELERTSASARKNTSPIPKTRGTPEHLKYRKEKLDIKRQPPTPKKILQRNSRLAEGERIVNIRRLQK